MFLTNSLYNFPGVYVAVCLILQDGTEGEDRLMGAAFGYEGIVFLGGFTTGLWGDSHAGGYDFARVLLNISDGTELFRWQVSCIIGR